MAHTEQHVFLNLLKEHLSEYFSGKRVLEVGSWDKNGTCRSLFDKCDYIGIDIAGGQGVDLVCRGEEFGAPSNSFDVALSLECFEHNIYWVLTLANMIRVLKPGGLLVMTCAGVGRMEHGTPRMSPADSLTAGQFGSSYYRNLTPADILKTGLLKPFSQYWLAQNWRSRDTYLVLIKRPRQIEPVCASSPSEFLPHPRLFIREINAMAQKYVPREVPVKYLSYQAIRAITALLDEGILHDYRYKRLSRRTLRPNAASRM